MFFKPFKELWKLKDAKGLHIDVSHIEDQLSHIEKQLKKNRECNQCIQNDVLLAYVEKAFKGRQLKKIKKEFNL